MLFCAAFLMGELPRTMTTKLLCRTASTFQKCNESTEDDVCCMCGRVITKKKKKKRSHERTLSPYGIYLSVHYCTIACTGWPPECLAGEATTIPIRQANGVGMVTKPKGRHRSATRWFRTKESHSKSHFCQTFSIF